MWFSITHSLIWKMNTCVQGHLYRVKRSQALRETCRPDGGHTTLMPQGPMTCITGISSTATSDKVLASCLSNKTNKACYNHALLTGGRLLGPSGVLGTKVGLPFMVACKHCSKDAALSCPGRGRAGIGKPPTGALANQMPAHHCAVACPLHADVHGRQPTNLI